MSKEVKKMNKNDRMSLATQPAFLSTKIDVKENVVQEFIDGSIQRVKLSDIMPYDKNPRIGVNPSFNDLKESIKAIGLQNKFAITLREGDTHYITYGGGNTRLEILKQLNADSGGKDYEYLEVEFRKYQGEAVSFARHVTENQLRAGFSFLNMAKIVADFKSMNEIGKDAELSTVELERLAKEQGFTIHRATVRPLLLASQLYPIFKSALDKGVSDEDTDSIGVSKLGRPKFDKLLRTVNQLHSIVSSKGISEKDVVAVIYDSVETYRDAFMDGKFETIEDYACRKLAVKIDMSFDDFKYQFKLAKNPELKKEIAVEAEVKTTVDSTSDLGKIEKDCTKSKKLIANTLLNLFEINPEMKDYVSFIKEVEGDLSAESVFELTFSDEFFYDIEGTYINEDVSEDEAFVIYGLRYLSYLIDLGLAMNLGGDKETIQSIVDDIKDTEQSPMTCRFHSDLNIHAIFGIEALEKIYPDLSQKTKDTYVFLIKLDKVIKKYISQIFVKGSLSK